MSRSKKANAVILCLLFGLPFGAVGVFATWVLFATVSDGLRARDWVKVAAIVDGYDSGEVNYRYRVDGREYGGKRLTVSPLTGSDTVSEELHSRLTEARSSRRPVTVFVNPQAPAESVVDRDIHWQELLFLLPFAFGFGGVGLGALWFMVHTLRGEQRKPAARVRSDGLRNLAISWAFTFMWNVIAFPIGIFVTLDAIESGEWVGLIALLFPLIGVLLLLGTIAGTVSLLRRGGAELHLATATPRMGSVLEGHIAFPRGVAAGDGFRVKLQCVQGKDDHGATVARWSSQQTVRVAQGPSGARLAFRFQVPAKVGKGADEDEEGAGTWRLEAERSDKLMQVPYGFDVAMQPAMGAALLEPESALDDEHVPAMAGGAPAEDFTQGAFAPHKLTRDQKEVLAGMTPEQRAQVAKLLAMKPLIKKVAIGVAVLIAALFVLPGIIALLLG